MKRALLIGINYYNTSYELHGCINDIVHMKSVLLDKYGFSESNITTLTEKALLPSKTNILNCIEKLVNGACPGDTLVFSYSGHGLNIPDYNHDEKCGFDDAIAPVDFQKVGFISDDDLFKLLISRVPKDVTLIAIFDCCHSGSICDLRWNYTFSEYVVSSWEENMNETQGNIVVISGCMDNQTSADAFIQYQSQGAFTFCLLEVLRQHNYNISVKELLRKVDILLASNSFPQRSQVSCSKNDLFEKAFSF